jgi:hypothetical protein
MKGSTVEGEGHAWLMYFLHKNEYRIFKSVEITIRRGQRQKGKKNGGTN